MAPQPDEEHLSPYVGLLLAKDQVYVVVLVELKTLGLIHFISQNDRYLLIVALLPVALYDYFVGSQARRRRLWLWQPLHQWGRLVPDQP